MKRSIIALSLSAVLTAGFSSCSDFLEQPVLGQENLDTYFQSENDCTKSITGCYQSVFYDDWWQIAKFWNLSSMCTDDMWMGNTSQDQGDYLSLAHYTSGGSSNGAAQNFWQFRYKGIYRCNVAINHIPDAPIANTELQKRLVGEAKFLRGYFYFDLARNFGGVPLLLTEAMPSDIKGITRSSLADTYAQVEKDLKDAIEVLPKRSALSSSDLGRATKGAAQGYLAKVYMYQEKYAEAEALLKDIIASGEYELLSDFGKVWAIESNNSKEGLFEVQYTYDATYGLGASLPIVSGSRDDSGWSWGLPTANLEKAFLDAGDNVRLKWTIIKHGATEIAGEDNFAGLLAGYSEAIKSTYPNMFVASPGNHKSARVSRKFYIPVNQRPATFNKGYIPQNHRLLRYADILLMYAEVENALGKDSEALIYLNKVRNRVQLSDLALTGTKLRDAIRTERRLELALEGERLYDIRRWKGDDSKPLVCSIMGPNGSFVKANTNEATADPFEWANQKENSNKGYYFDEKRDLLFPIPISEVTMSEGTIEQNPGY